MSGQQHALAALYPWKDPVPIVQEAGWAPGLVWTGGKISSSPGFDPGTSSLWSVAIPTGLPGPHQPNSTRGLISQEIKIQVVVIIYPDL